MQNLLIVSSVLLWIAVLFNFLLILALAKRVAKIHVFDAPETLRIGSEAPQFKAETIEGEEVELQAYEGKKVAFIFIGPNCQPCHEALPHLSNVIDIAKQHYVELMLVGDGDKLSMKELTKKYQLPIPILSAPQKENKFFLDYKIFSTPSFCLLDVEHKVRAAGYPGIDLGDLKTSIVSMNGRR